MLTLTSSLTLTLTLNPTNPKLQARILPFADIYAHYLASIDVKRGTQTFSSVRRSGFHPYPLKYSSANDACIMQGRYYLFSKVQVLTATLR